MKIKPHAAFDYSRADEVAECWEGISGISGLYEALWAIVHKQKPIPNLEDSGPNDHVGFECLSSHWEDLSEHHQSALNQLALAQDQVR